MVSILPAEQGQKRDLEDVRRWDRDLRGDVEDQNPLVEEGLVAVECKPNFLGEGGSDGVVRMRGEGKEEGHVAYREDDAPTIE